MAKEDAYKFILALGIVVFLFGIINVFGFALVSQILMSFFGFLLISLAGYLLSKKSNRPY
jgi:LPXTG-motif cell wall-anchored protein